MPQRRLPMVKSATQTRKTRMRPKDSESLPASGMTAVCASWKPVRVQPTQTRLVWRSVMMFGRATETTVPSMENISRLAAARPKNR
jgi:hypothetical protein